MRFLFFIGLTAVLTVPALGELSLRNAIVAVVNDAVITRQELETFTGQAVEALRRSFRNQPKVLEERYVETLKDGLNQLIHRQLILDDFKSLGGVLPENVIEDEIKDRIRRQYGDRATLTKSLQQRGITTETFRQKTREEIIVNFMRNRNIASSVVISPAKIENYYTNHMDQYQVGEQVRLRMIVLNRPTRTPAEEVARLALEIQTKVQEGADFASMASIYSDGSSRREGGDWDWIERSRLNAGLSEIAFALQPGQLSGVLALAREPNDDYWIYRYDPTGRMTHARKFVGQPPEEFLEERTFAANDPAPADLPAPREFYLMRVEARRDARTRPLDEVREEIEKELETQERAGREKRWLDRLAAKSFVVRYQVRF